jgi:hypothetical protein
MRIRLGLAAALAALTVGAPGAEAARWNKALHSVPGLAIPRVWTTIDDPAKSPGFIFVTPRAKPRQRTGPTILNADGRVVWFHRLSAKRTAINLHPQTYRGKPVLTWGQRPPLVHEGDLYTGNAHTVYNVIADQSYRTIARVRAHGRGINTDLHEFEITRRNTALILGFRTLNRNLRKYGGPEHSAILDNVVQEVDIRTGRVLFQWSAARKLSPRASYIRPPATGGWDAYHVNSVSEDSDGNLLLTVRHMSQVVKIDRKTGHVIWRLGGKTSDFRLGSGANIVYPHDAQRAPDGTITIFDNRSTAFDTTHGNSRGVRIKLNTMRKTASLAREYRHPTGVVFSTSQGNVNELPGKNIFVGWGSSPWWSEYAPDGHLVFAGHFQSIWNQSYRAYKGPWVGKPDDSPSLNSSVRTGTLVAYVSWNGATEVRQWQFLAGDDPNALLAPIGTVDWTDFETKAIFPGAPKFVQVQALDANGAVIGESPVMKPQA